MGIRCLCCSCLLTTVIFIGGFVCLIVFLGVLPYKNMKNSNKKTSISYYYIGSTTYCYDLVSVSLTPFPQGSKNTTVLSPVFKGQASLKLRGSDLKDFSNGQRDGSYSIYVELYLTSKLTYAGGGRSSSTSIVGPSNNQTVTGGIFNTKSCKTSTVNSSSD
ncbi:hypothetical protein MKX01_004724 [Papaver californicum]|nr:hypothetical protein MKX01_004724 [Papaver californicum]